VLEVQFFPCRISHSLEYGWLKVSVPQQLAKGRVWNTEKLHMSELMSTIKPGLVVLFGSGETSASGGKVFERIYGLRLVLVPHWNNDDGGKEVDTTCSSTGACQPKAGSPPKQGLAEG